jgi:hypothetical protein
MNRYLPGVVHTLITIKPDAQGGSDEAVKFLRQAADCG